MEMFLAPIPMVYTFRSLFVLLGCVLMLVTATKETDLTAKVLKHWYRYHKICKAFSNFFHRHSELIVIYNIGFKNSSATVHIRASMLW